MKILIDFLYILGMFFCFCGVVGVLRMPDVYCRLQTSTKNVTLGSLSIYLAIILENGLSSFTVKVIIIAIFILITNPVGSHAIARGALRNGIGLSEKSCCNDYRGNA